MTAGDWVRRTASRYRALTSRYADLRRRLRNLWHLADYDWSRPGRDAPRPWPREEAKIIDLRDPLRETYEAIRKEDTREA